MVELRHVHWVAAKHVYQYGTVGYVPGDGVRLQRYTVLTMQRVQLTERAPEGVASA
jgi:hypothetical protein